LDTIDQEEEVDSTDSHVCDALEAALPFTCQTGRRLHLWKVSGKNICFQHTKYDTNPHICPHCKKVLSSLPNLTNHIRQAHKWGGNKLILWKGKGVYTSLVYFIRFHSLTPASHFYFLTHIPTSKMKRKKSRNSYFVEGGGHFRYCSTKTSVLKGEWAIVILTITLQINISNRMSIFGSLHFSHFFFGLPIFSV